MRHNDYGDGTLLIPVGKKHDESAHPAAQNGQQPQKLTKKKQTEEIMTE